MNTISLSRRSVLRLLGAAGAAAFAGCESSADVTPTATRSLAPTPDATQHATASIVRQVDHVLLRTDDAATTLAVLTDTLDIPVAWPMFEYRGFHSGAAGFGSTNLEVLQPAGGDTPSFASASGTYLMGMAFEPVTVESAVAQLDSRSIGHSEPFVDELNDVIAWTSVDLETTEESPISLLVKYKFDQDARRSQLGSQLRERRGGPLRVRALERIEIGVRDRARSEARWQRLFDPTQPFEPGHWQLGAGPTVRLLHADDDRMQRVVLTVESLSSAVAALRTRSLLGEQGDDWADIRGLGGAVRLRGA